MADQEKGNELASAVATLTTLVQNLATKVEQLASQSAPAEVAGLKRTVGELAQKFATLESVTKVAIQERERERQTLIQELAGNWRCTFGATELESKPVEELRRLAQMLKADNFSGRGGPQDGAINEQRFAEPRPYFAKEEKGGK